MTYTLFQLSDAEIVKEAESFIKPLLSDGFHIQDINTNSAGTVQFILSYEFPGCMKKAFEIYKHAKPYSLGQRMEIEIDYKEYTKISFYQILSTNGSIELLIKNPMNDRRLLLWF